MSFSNYSEEDIYKQRVLNLIKGQEKKYIDIFLQKGPDFLRKELNITKDMDWFIIFDYLVFDHDLLFICLLKFKDFFISLVSAQGSLALRKIFGIEDRLYDQIFESLFDFIISTGAIFSYVHTQKSRFIDLIKRGDSDVIRQELCLMNPKHNSIWQKILEILIGNFTEEIISERIAEQGLQSFTFFMNVFRTHRSL